MFECDCVCVFILMYCIHYLHISIPIEREKHMHAHMRTNTCTHMNTLTHIHAITHIHTHVPIWTQKYLPNYASDHNYTCIGVHPVVNMERMHTKIPTQLCTHPHLHMYMHITYGKHEEDEKGVEKRKDRITHCRYNLV